MSTKKIFEGDSYLKTTQSSLVSQKENIAIFQQTVFYAQSGGQPGDTGEIETPTGEKIAVLNTTYDENRNICHHLEKPLPQTEGIFELRIDWLRRYQLMKMHSCMHLVCSQIEADVTGGAIGLERSRIDFDLKGQLLEKETITEKLNALIQKGAPIFTYWWEKEKLEQNPSLVRTRKVFPPSFEGKYRIVEIQGIDLQPCGGTHLKNIQEIGKVVISKIKSKGGSNRRLYLQFQD